MSCLWRLINGNTNSYSISSSCWNIALNSLNIVFECLQYKLNLSVVYNLLTTTACFIENMDSVTNASLLVHVVYQAKFVREFYV